MLYNIDNHDEDEMRLPNKKGFKVQFAD